MLLIEPARESAPQRRGNFGRSRENEGRHLEGAHNQLPQENRRAKEDYRKRDIPRIFHESITPFALNRPLIQCTYGANSGKFIPSSARGRGIFTGTSSMMQPGRGVITRTLSARKTASGIEWVMKSTDFFRSRQMR